ncbi:UpxY family transcription antiterminator [Chitinophagaceae bacterium LB-8]|uniref:UpxY family transcription antiterminator n=1 Tax=Paraflavisolibacter caeni TaxID=2982496 RepID=A0A9X2XMP0_9BACT|nr:UpxY family transcription antiterminator [Paraflavisolibacter caeni]MCU7547498.1 UpxY family transcription antiterminator [Paraflavisolibacter caeni]
MNKEPLWYVLYTKPRWQEKVAGQLARKGVEHYCPMNRLVRPWRERKELIHEPLFKSYVFVRIKEEELFIIKKTQGVLNFVYWLGKPAIISNEEIEVITKFLGEHNNVQLEKTGVSVQDKITEMNGQFMYQDGQDIQLTDKLVKVQLPSLGYALVAQVSKEIAKVVQMKPVMPKQTQLIAK